jgi:hypothetical protein
MPLGRIRARLSCTVHATHAHSAGSARCTARAARDSAMRAHVGAVTALRARVTAQSVAVLQRRRWSKRWRSSTHDGEATHRAWRWRR